MVFYMEREKVIETYRKVVFFKQLLKSINDHPVKQAISLNDAISTLVSLERNIEFLEHVEKELLDKYPWLKDIEV